MKTAKARVTAGGCERSSSEPAPVEQPQRCSSRARARRSGSRSAAHGPAKRRAATASRRWACGRETRSLCTSRDACDSKARSFRPHTSDPFAAAGRARRPGARPSSAARSTPRSWTRPSRRAPSFCPRRRLGRSSRRRAALRQCSNRTGRNDRFARTSPSSARVRPDRSRRSSVLPRTVRAWSRSAVTLTRPRRSSPSTGSSTTRS